MSLAIDYLAEKEIFETDLQHIEEKLGHQGKYITLNEIKKINR